MNRQRYILWVASQVLFGDIKGLIFVHTMFSGEIFRIFIQCKPNYREYLYDVYSDTFIAYLYVIYTCLYHLFIMLMFLVYLIICVIDSYFNIQIICHLISQFEIKLTLQEFKVLRRQSQGIWLHGMVIVTQCWW